MSRAWTKFIKNNRGPFKETLAWKTNFPVRNKKLASSSKIVNSKILVFIILISTTVFDTRTRK